MRKVYSNVTGVYLGVIFERLGIWYAEDRATRLHRCGTQSEAVERLKAQPENRLAA